MAASTIIPAVEYVPVDTDLQKLHEAFKTYRDLPADIYGLAIAVSVVDLPEVITCRATKAQTAGVLFGFTALSVNLWLQGLILYYVNHYIVQGAVHEAQENYAEFHRKVFDEDGNFLHGVWQTYDTDKYAALCNMAVSKLYFSCGIVFLWTARMLAEVKQSLHLMHDLYCIPQLPLSATAKQMVYQVKDGDEIERFEILALNRMVRIMLTVLIALPKIGVAFILMLSGCRWLAATQSFGDLILNALALEFVIGIDELMFEAFTPEQTRSFIEQTKIAYPREGEGGIQNESSMSLLLNTLGIILNLAWSYMYLNDWQQVLPNFSHDIRAHCQSRFAEMYTLKCPFMGDPDECFPFGE